MSGIRSALEEMAGVRRYDLSSGELAADIVELARVIQTAEMLQSRRMKIWPPGVDTMTWVIRLPLHSWSTRPESHLFMPGGSSPMATPPNEHPTPTRRGPMAGCRPTRCDTCMRLPKPSQTNTRMPKSGWWRSWRVWMRSTPPKQSPTGGRQWKDPEPSTRWSNKNTGSASIRNHRGDASGRRLAHPNRRSRIRSSLGRQHPTPPRRRCPHATAATPRRPRKPMPRLARQRHHPHHRRRKTPHRHTHRPESTPRRRRRTPRNRKRTNHRRRHPENDRL
jgi:hypothetical protein